MGNETSKIAEKMGNEKSKIAEKFRRISNTRFSFATSKSISICQPASINVLQNVLLIWLDATINKENNTDCRDIISLFRRIVNNIYTFTDSDQCIEFINTIDTKNNTACMVISGSLGQQIISRVHNMSQVDSIFIFCNNKQYHEQWANNWSKIKGVFTEVTPLREALKNAREQCELNGIPISFMATNTDIYKNLDQQDCLFMYTRILKDVLSTIKFEKKHINEFIEHCRGQFADIEQELANVNEMEKNYSNTKPIWWYTCECFLCPMLNSALRRMDIGLIIKMGFFIDDLHRQIEKLHSEQFNKHQSNITLTVYRGQGMSIELFEQMKKTKNGLLAFNGFLSTSKDRNISLPFARNALVNPGLVGILFVMTVNPSSSITPFASINDVSYFEDRKDEILFSMHAVFCIRDIKPMDENHRLYQVDLTMINKDDNNLCRLTNRIREKTEGSTAWDQLGNLLLRINRAEKAEQLYELLLAQTTNENEKAYVYRQLGWAKRLQGNYNEALALYEKSLRIQQELHTSDADLANSYGYIGMVYYEMGEYLKALSHYENASMIQEQLPSQNQHDLAVTYNNIASVYCKMHENWKAISLYTKALEIKKKTLPPKHIDFCKCYSNMSVVYMTMGEFRKAVLLYEKVLDIQQISLPSDHPNLAATNNSLGWVHEKMGNYLKAYPYYENAVDIGRQSLPPNNAELQTYRDNLERAKKSL